MQNDIQDENDQGNLSNMPILDDDALHGGGNPDDQEKAKDSPQVGKPQNHGAGHGNNQTAPDWESRLSALENAVQEQAARIKEIEQQLEEFKRGIEKGSKTKADEPLKEHEAFPEGAKRRSMAGIPVVEDPLLPSYPDALWAERKRVKRP